MYPPNSFAGKAGGAIGHSMVSLLAWGPPSVTVGVLNWTVAKLGTNDGVNVFSPVESAGSWPNV